MCFLIFEIESGGHFSEYVRYIIGYVVNYRSDDDFVFALSQRHKELLGDHCGSDNRFHNCNFIFFSDFEYVRCTTGGAFKQAWYRSLLLRNCAKRHRPDKIILLWARPYFPWLTMLPCGNKVNTIEYLVPGWRKKPVSLRHRFFDWMQYRLYSNLGCVNKVFLLNDTTYPRIYNELYDCNKFGFLPDPVEVFGANDDEPRGDDDRITLLHAGRLHREKGTFDILDAMDLLTDEQKRKFRLVICGKPQTSGDNDKISSRVERLMSDPDLEVEFHNGFVAVEFLHRQYQKADYVLIPYYNYSQSSGNLGHAASYGKPVIGPSMGLLGKLIKDNGLGYVLDELSSAAIAKVLVRIYNGDKISVRSREYAVLCDPDEFARILLDG